MRSRYVSKMKCPKCHAEWIVGVHRDSDDFDSRGLDGWEYDDPDDTICGYCGTDGEQTEERPTLRPSGHLGDVSPGDVTVPPSQEKKIEVREPDYEAAHREAPERKKSIDSFSRHAKRHWTKSRQIVPEQQEKRGWCTICERWDKLDSDCRCMTSCSYSITQEIE